MVLNSLKRAFAITALCFAVVVAWGAQGMAQEPVGKLIPKIDNFIIFQDYSGSMGLNYTADSSDSKIEISKAIIEKMNGMIPQLGYTGSLYTFAPFEEMAARAVYHPANISAGVQKINTDFPIFGRLTPIGDGLRSLEPLLASAGGERTAVIIISDGRENKGIQAINAAREIYAAYSGHVCFHIISLANEDTGKAVLDEIANFNPCTVYANGADLLNDNAMADFVRRVFYDEGYAVREALVLQDVLFDFDKAELRSDMLPILNEAYETIKDWQGGLILAGHTCNLGDAAYNQGLSQNRARSVADYMIQQGIPASQIQVIGYGLRNPKYSNDTEATRKLNRRVEILMPQ